LLTSFLYGVTMHDPWALASAPFLLVLCGVLVAYTPARRAASIDPLQALRSE
jgi:ABC-type antimicrobial peptide transport system permease subunit